MIWVILLICLFFVFNKTRFSLFSPVVLFILFFILSIVLTIPYHYLMPSDWKFSIALVDKISDKRLWMTLHIFGQMLVYFCLGVIIYKYTFNIRKNPPLNLDLSIKLPYFNPGLLIGVSILIVLMDLVLLYFTYGKTIFFRQFYHPDHDRLLTMLMEYSLLFLAFFAGVLYQKQKIASIFFIFFVVLMCIGFGSRMATIYLMVYLFSIFLLYVKKGKKLRFILFFSPLILVFFGWNIAMRFNGTAGHGLIPYLMIPFRDPAAIVENTFFNIYYTLIFGVFATAKTMLKYPEGIGYLLTSLNPAPGGMTDWYQIYNRMRINHYMPFAGIGEIFSFPWIAPFFYMFVGFFFSVSEKRIYKLLSSRQFVPGFILFLLTAAFIPYSFEYNLRSSVRFIYYSLFFMLILAFIPKNLFKKKAKENSTHLES